MLEKSSVLNKVLALKAAFDQKKFGDQPMPEDCHPLFRDQELQYTYFTLPMAINYQRNSYKLWEAANATLLDPLYEDVFAINSVAAMDFSTLQYKLSANRLSLQPNNHTKIWMTIAVTIDMNWKTLTNFFAQHDNDFLKVKQTVQSDYKSGFPYLSGPKIFNYWAHIMERYCNIAWNNREYIEIAPDTHVIQASIKLGVITLEEAQHTSREQLSAIWRNLLQGTSIAPIDMHSPLWFWSHDGFTFLLN